ncbi:putative polysaccharide biosynthesis protein [Jeotgalibacillus aurantiacus]|uniref:putative polysaccharide biosynthesis protein n=1 Tax=Jeotgalibacillus aurantiacus TaxID=2763266 RepID=UPI001D0A761A|nr:polysaccharide biosynthesis protein [Jeotgalibacillus aurantiacus]
MTDASQTMVKGAAVLTLAAVISKILSALYRVPFQNMTGDIGFYIYQQVYPFYGLLIALCTYAFPVMVSRILIEHEEDRERIFKLLGLVLAGTGLVWFLALYLGAPLIAEWMGDPMLEPLIRLSAWPFLLLPFLAGGKGWFQAQNNMVPSAVSQVTEQLVRVTIILAATFVLTAHGASLYTIGEGAVVGSTVGLAVGVLLLLYLGRVQLKGQSFALSFKKGDRAIFRALIVRGTAMGMVSMLLILYQMMDALNVYSLLTGYTGSAEEAKTVKGVYDRGQPLIQIGIVAATSLSLAVVPMIAADMERNRIVEVKKKAALALKTGIVFGAAASIGLMNIIRPLNTFLFQTDEGSRVLALYVLAVLFASIALTVNAVLQGMGSYHIIAWLAAVSVAVKYILNDWLVPLFGTGGAAAATVLAILVVTVAAVLRLRAKIGFLLTGRFYMRLLLGLIVMTVVVQGLLWLWPDGSRLSAAAVSILAAAVGAWSFFVVSWSRDLFTKEEAAQIPFGRKLDRLFYRSGK